MNYAVVILFFVFALATGYWYLRGRHYYTGPRTLARIEGGRIIREDGVVETPAVHDQEKAAGLNQRVPARPSDEEI